QEGFPLLTTKRVPFRLIASELLWFLKGDTNIRYLLEHNNNIWNEWAFKNWVHSAEYTGPNMDDFGVRSQKDAQFKQQYDEQMVIFKEKILKDDTFAERYGDLGLVYGSQWRRWKTSNNETIDQIQDVIDSIKTNPNSRRHIVSAWNTEDIPNVALPPSHTLFQFYFNIASYALLTHLIAEECGLVPGEFVHTFGDVHLYSNHIQQMELQLSRTPEALPELKIKTKKASIFDYELEDFEIIGYEPHPSIK